MNNIDIINFVNMVKPASGAVFEPFVGDDGIYMRSDIDPRFGRIVMTKELFVEAYNKWIKYPVFSGEDDADDWCE